MANKVGNYGTSYRHCWYCINTIYFPNTIYFRIYNTDSEIEKILFIHTFNSSATPANS